MRKTPYFIFCTLFLMVISFHVKGQTWQLVWQDEFTNGISADWVFETGTGSGGWGNNELQYYRQENATVSNGALGSRRDARLLEECNTRRQE
jgi:beta-glucanase (GH16 family)